MSSNSRLEPLTLNQVFKLPPKEWLVKDFIGKNDLGMIFGEPGCGKTFLVIDLLFAGALGNQWAGRFDILRPLNVAYCGGEGHSGLPGRFKAAARRWNISDDDPWTLEKQLILYRDVPLLFSPPDPQGNQTTNLLEFIESYQQMGIPLDLLVIDTLHSATTGAEENSAKDAGYILGMAKHLRDLLDCTVLFVHHSNKSGTSERGSSAFRAAMDLMVEVERQGNGCSRMKYSKAKDAEPFDPLEFRVVPGESEGSSAHIEWTGRIFETASPQRRNTNEWIEMFFQDHSSEAFTVPEVKTGIESQYKQALDAGTVRNGISSLKKDGVIVQSGKKKRHPLYRLNTEGNPS